MAYTGQTFLIPCNLGGWSANPNYDQLPPQAMEDTTNINLHLGGRTPRGGTSKINDEPITDSPKVMGVYQFIKKNGDSFIITLTSDGKIYSNYTTLLKEGLATDKIGTFETFNDKVYICNGANCPQVWDGSAGSTADIANIPSDWTGSNYPKRIIKHGRGASERLWAIGCPLNPTRIYVSTDGYDDFSQATVLVLNIETGDGLGIIEAIEFGDRLVCFGKRQPYLIDDTDLNTANWGYVNAQWLGGIGALRLVAKTPNDIVVMTEDGEIYSVRAAENYGDYESASLIRPAYLNKWIQENIDLSKITQFHMVYDPELRAVRTFVIRKGKSVVDTCLVYFVDRDPVDGWTKHGNLINPSGFDAASSTVVKTSTGEYKVYTGDYSGHVWGLEQTIKNDDGKYFYAGFLTVPTALDTPRGTKNFHTGWLTIRPRGSETINVNIYIDKVPFTEQFLRITDDDNYRVTSDGDNRVGDALATEGKWQVMADSTKAIQDLNYRIGANGKRIQFEIFNNAVNEDFFINELMVDFKPISARN